MDGGNYNVYGVIVCERCGLVTTESDHNCPEGQLASEEESTEVESSRVSG